MSYVRSRRRGLGESMVFAPTSQLIAISTSQPSAPAATIPPLEANRTPTKRLTVSVGGKMYPVCQDPTSPKKDGWGWEEGKSCKQLAYPFCQSPVDAAGTGWGWENGKSCLVPITLSAPATTQQPATSNCGKPGYEAFTAEFCGGASQPSQPILMTMVNPAEQQQAVATMAAVGSGQKTVASSMPGQQSFPGQDSGGGGYITPAGQGGSVTPAAFAASCQALGGKSGTNCCKLPSGVSVGLDYAGQMTQISACETGMGNLPLIAAAVVGVFLLSRML